MNCATLVGELASVHKADDRHAADAKQHRSLLGRNRRVSSEHDGVSTRLQHIDQTAEG